MEITEKCETNTWPEVKQKSNRVIEPETRVKNSEVVGQPSHVEITEKCHNCGMPNLIDKPRLNGAICGWCGTEYERGYFTGQLIVKEIHNNHLTERVCLRKDFEWI